MLDLISRYVSVISLVVVTALSIFNIGYYWKIGLHFLGLADFSNLVYSAGLSTTVISVWMAAALFVSNRKLSEAQTLCFIAAGGAIAIFGLFLLSPRTSSPQLTENAAVLVGLLLSSTTFLSWIRLKKDVRGYWEGRDLILAAFALFTVTFQAGSFAAALELSDRFRYIISTKSGVLEDARILRSSSAGFLLSVQQDILFIPQGEIRNVRSKENNR